MVQVSYPGVYIREVPSGARTITGVATSITAFVGMAKRGPVNKPTVVLGFTDYVRIFSDDVSQGEMTDQVRQFFINGGQQAIITRIAGGASGASFDLPVGVGGAGTLAITSRGSGGDENLLRLSVDYNTASPERTFNLTIYREIFDASGNASVGESETHGNLSLNENDPRYVVKVLELESQLVTATLTGISPSGSSVSVSGAIARSDDNGGFVELVRRAIGTGTQGKFRMRIGSETKTITIATPTGNNATFASDLGDAIALEFPSATVDVAVVESANDADVIEVDSNGDLVLDSDDSLILDSNDQPVTALSTLEVLTITVTDEEVALSSASSDDIGVALGLGTGNGGLEYGLYGAQRPATSGYVSDATLADLLNFAVSSPSEFTDQDLVLAGTQPFTIAAGSVQFASPAFLAKESFGPLRMSQGTATSGDSLSNVAQQMNAIATAINRFQNDWLAQVHGVRLALLPQFGSATSGTGHAFTTPTGTPTSFVSTDGIFDSVTAATAANTMSGGADGGAPGVTDYADAYVKIDSDVDLFNILVLPRSSATPNSRTALWGAASSFCLSRRAFLLIDAEPDVVTVDDAVQAVKDARLGIVKDHSALYWPRIDINPDGNRRFIDPSGSVAGIMSRIDSNRGVWKAPAGNEADIRAALGVRVPMSDPENGRLNPQALNAIRVFPGGITVWGARTMDGFDNSGNDDYKYVPVRRFTSFIEESLYRGLKFAVFEPNAEPLWAQLRLAVGAFMNNLFRQGAFAGETTRESYFVKVDAETTTQNDVNLGIVNVVVGFAPLKPAEFVVVTIKQMAGQVQV